MPTPDIALLDLMVHWKRKINTEEVIEKKRNVEYSLHYKTNKKRGIIFNDCICELRTLYAMLYPLFYPNPFRPYILQALTRLVHPSTIK